MPRVLLALVLLLSAALLAAPVAVAAGKKAPKRTLRRSTAVLKVAQAPAPTIPAFGLGHVKAEWLAGYDGAEGVDAQGLRDLDLMRDAGAGLYRASFRQERVADATGAFTRWTMLDHLVLQSAARGITLLPILMRMTEQDGYDPPRTAEERATFAAFAAAAARRYGPDGDFWTQPGSPWESCAGCEPRPVRVWEVWNEENTAPYWDAPDPAGYGALLAAVRPALRGEDPAARILLGGLADVDGRATPGELTPREFLRRVVAAVGPDAFDAVAVHAYHSDPAVAVERLRTLAVTMGNTGGRQRSGAPRQQLWVTEFGRPTTPGNAATLRAQGSWMKRFMDRALASRAAWNLGPMVAYAMRDHHAASEPWHFLGLRATTPDDADGGAKPGWDAFAERAQGAAPLPLPALR